MTEIKYIKSINQKGWFDFRRIQSKIYGAQVTAVLLDLPLSRLANDDGGGAQ